MNKKWVVLISLLVVYVLGFFAITPLSMLATSTQSAPVMNFVHSIHTNLYWSWVQNIDESNVMHKVWNNNGLFWCNQFQGCTVKHD